MVSNQSTLIDTSIFFLITRPLYPGLSKVKSIQVYSCVEICSTFEYMDHVQYTKEDVLLKANR